MLCYEVCELFSSINVRFYIKHIIMLSSYCHEAVDGVEPETEFMYDLQLPADFVPAPSDGEVSRYYLWGMDKVHCTTKIYSHSRGPQFLHCIVVIL